MQFTSLYWRQLYLYLAKQQRRQRLQRRRMVLEAFAAAQPSRPLPGAMPRRSSSMPN